MKKLKVGYLPLYIKLYDDANPDTRKPLVAYMETLISMLESQGLEIVRADVCRIKSEFDAAAELFNKEDVDAVITQHLAYSPSLESIDALLKIKAELVVLDTTPDYELVSVAGYKNGISPNHGIHGVQDMCNLLKQHGRQFTLCVGHAMHDEVIAEAAGMCRAAAAAKAYRNAKVGSVGGSFVGMGDFKISDQDYKEKIGADVLYMTPEVVDTYVGKVTEEEIQAEMNLDKKRFTWEVENEESYQAAVKSGLAVRKWVEEERLTAATVNFLTLDECGLPKMPFAECSKMLERGLGYAGEGDVLTAGLVGALRSVYPETTFVEMFCPDWKDDVLLLSHMGEANLSLAKWKPVLRNVPFRYNSCGETAAAYFCMKPGNAVYVNLAPMGEGFTLIVTPVEMLDAGLEFGAYRNSVQGWMKPCKRIKDFLKEYSKLGGTHHSAMVYGADIQEIVAFGEMMGFDVAVID